MEGCKDIYNWARDFGTYHMGENFRIIPESRILRLQNPE